VVNDVVFPLKYSNVRRHLEYYQYLEEEEEYYRQQEEMLLREQEIALQQQQQQQQLQHAKPAKNDEVRQATDEAAKAAQETARAAAEASQGLMKGISSLGGNLMEQSGGFGFGFGSGNKKGAASGFSIGGFGLGSLGGAQQPAKKTEPVKTQQQKQQTALQTKAVAEVKKPIVQADMYAKPYTAHMTAQERWWWAYRMTVQVKTATTTTSTLPRNLHLYNLWIILLDINFLVFIFKTICILVVHLPNHLLLTKNV
jgi:hypothetical protein